MTTDPRLKPVGMTKRDWDLLIAEREVKRRAEAYPNTVKRVKDAIRFIEEGAPLSARSGLLALLRDLGEVP